ncbi:MAG TPA: M28 family metallopeptidase [Candidatus Acidoferrales bacterium]|nr:M28 family metallopeptidase [Candidatus Acidoferrales bacterium]
MADFALLNEKSDGMQRSARHALILALGLACAISVLAKVRRAPAGNRIRGFLASRVAAEEQLEQKLRSIPEAAHAESNLRHLTSEPHMAGTEASHRVAEWLRAQYESYGFDAAIVSYSVWLPMPIEVHLEIAGPDQKTLATQEQPYDVDKDTFDHRAAIGFNTYSPSGDVTAQVVYANYGMVADYRVLEARGISVEGKIVLARYGKGYRGIKARLAEEHKAAGLIIFSDPSDDGYDAGDVFPGGPWRPASGIQRGSILYTEIYPGDPLTPGFASTFPAKHLAPADAASLPRIPTIPINSQDAAAILSRLDGPKVPRDWQGGLAMTYHAGPGPGVAHLKVAMDYQQHTIYDVIARLRGEDNEEWVVLGNHHDAWVYGAVDPGSGTATMLELGRSLGELARSGWKPRRSIVICEWDGEEPGLLGSTEWVEDNLKELQAKAVTYINTDVGVAGPNFSASASPSLSQFIREATREVADPISGRTVYEMWKDRVEHPKPEGGPAVAREEPLLENGDVAVGALGAGSDFCAFFDHAGIPSMDLGFGGDYGVYHSLYDDFFWMKHFGDPTFDYHAALARILDTLVLRLDEADVLPFDYSAYAADIQRRLEAVSADAKKSGLADLNLNALSDAVGNLSRAAAQATPALKALETSPPLDPARYSELNHDLADLEQAFLSPRGLIGRSWYKHTLYAPGTYAGYEATRLPGLREAVDRKDAPTAQQEADEIAAAVSRAAAQLQKIAQVALPASAAPASAPGQ